MSPSNKGKIDPQKPVCKEFDCSEPSKINGYCRLHFLRLVKAKSKGATLEDSASGDKAKTERRKRNRLEGLDSGEVLDSDPVIATVESLGVVDNDITQLIDVVDAGALPPSEFIKKTKKAA